MAELLVASQALSRSRLFFCFPFSRFLGTSARCRALVLGFGASDWMWRRVGEGLGGLERAEKDQ